MHAVYNTMIISCQFPIKILKRSTRNRNTKAHFW